MKKIFGRMNLLRGEMSVSAFAKRIGVPQPTMDRYLKGREPPIGVVEQLSLEYHVTADWLLGLTDNPSPNSGGIVQSAGTGSVVIGGSNHGEVHATAESAGNAGNAGLAPPRTEQARETPDAPAPSCRDCPTVAALREAVNALREAVAKMGGK